VASEGFPWRLVLGLAFAQLVSWGVFFYAFAILTTPMGAEFGWSKAEMNGALSLGLAVTGMASFAVGRWIDRRGGRLLMVVGSIIGAILLALWSQITSLWQLYAIWVGIGIVSAMVLYEAAFAVVARALPKDYRRGITTITLLGGLASTAFIPLTQALVDLVGWRHALLGLLLIQLPVCTAIPWYLLRGKERPVTPARSVAEGRSGAVSRAMRHPTFWLLIVSFVSFALLFTALLFSLLPILDARGFSVGQAVAVYAVIGPSQVLGRMVLFAMERLLTVTMAGVCSTCLIVVAMVLLGGAQSESFGAFAFAVTFGIGMGVKTIVQATAAPEFLGREGYGALQGAIMTPVYVAQAAAPFAAALIWDIGGGHLFLERVLLVSAVVSVASFALAAFCARSRPAIAKMG
jgi:MFS family permease